jgi:hypothetical protein
LGGATGSIRAETAQYLLLGAMSDKTETLYGGVNNHRSGWMCKVMKDGQQLFSTLLSAD